MNKPLYFLFYIDKSANCLKMDHVIYDNDIITAKNTKSNTTIGSIDITVNKYVELENGSQYDSEEGQYANVNTKWMNIFNNQMSGSKLYFITSTHGYNCEGYNTSVPSVATGRSGETATTGFVPTFHGYLTMCKNTHNSDKLAFTFSGIDWFFSKKLMDCTPNDSNPYPGEWDRVYNLKHDNTDRSGGTWVNNIDHICETMFLKHIMDSGKPSNTNNATDGSTNDPNIFGEKIFYSNQPRGRYLNGGNDEEVLASAFNKWSTNAKTEIDKMFNGVYYGSTRVTKAPTNNILMVPANGGWRIYIDIYNPKPTKHTRDVMYHNTDVIYNIKDNYYNHIYTHTGTEVDPPLSEKYTVSTTLGEYRGGSNWKDPVLMVQHNVYNGAQKEEGDTEQEMWEKMGAWSKGEFLEKYRKNKIQHIYNGEEDLFPDLRLDDSLVSSSASQLDLDKRITTIASVYEDGHERFIYKMEGENN